MDAGLARDALMMDVLLLAGQPSSSISSLSASGARRRSRAGAMASGLASMAAKMPVGSNVSNRIDLVTGAMAALPPD